MDKPAPTGSILDTIPLATLAPIERLASVSTAPKANLAPVPIPLKAAPAIPPVA